MSKSSAAVTARGPSTEWQTLSRGGYGPLRSGSAPGWGGDRPASQLAVSGRSSRGAVAGQSHALLRRHFPGPLPRGGCAYLSVITSISSPEPARHPILAPPGRSRHCLRQARATVLHQSAVAARACGAALFVVSGGSGSLPKRGYTWQSCRDMTATCIPASGDCHCLPTQQKAQHRTHELPLPTDEALSREPASGSGASGRAVRG